MDITTCEMMLLVWGFFWLVCFFSLQENIIHSCEGVLHSVLKKWRLFDSTWIHEYIGLAACPRKTGLVCVKELKMDPGVSVRQRLLRAALRALLTREASCCWARPAEPGSVEASCCFTGLNATTPSRSSPDHDP
jgi:hypothetical protein